MIRFRKHVLIIVMFVIVSALPQVASAHDIWIVVQNAPAKGQPLTVAIPSDHTFPASHREFMPEEKLIKSYIICPGGRTIGIKSDGNNKFESSEKLTESGTYMAVSGKKGSFWTKTTEGTKEGIDKTSIKNPIKGTYSEKFTKSIFFVEKTSGNVFSKTAGFTLEIIPLKDPCSLKEGDALPVKLLFKGKPFAGELKATYSGFSKEENKFAFTIKSNEKGEADIKLTNKGEWLVKADNRIPFADVKKADEHLYSSTLTFSIK